MLNKVMVAIHSNLYKWFLIDMWGYSLKVVKRIGNLVVDIYARRGRVFHFTREN